MLKTLDTLILSVSLSLEDLHTMLYYNVELKNTEPKHHQ
ncbi:hypothetical protein Gohar_004727 [Gossypium harknessii]|uniref:Uncharacterized protein n=2 Tax=Gossypium TaxID=3633 RepID=A0A7J9JIL3_9ROSI|nr:hypothetical protein [Gossypium harknessii]MBA0834262.1 hypothetical protein [Gossypium armourianum]